MKSWFLKGTVVTAAIVLPALNGMAWAGDTNDHFVCSNATLRGDYAFSVLTVTTTPGVPNVVVVLGTFDGKGGYTQIDYPGDSGLADFRMGQTGSYTVNRDCTGFQTINLGGGAVVENAFVISNGGRSFHGVVADFKVGGTEVPGQTRVDGWKVAPEQDD
jgi:hypothetical protein